jgi:2-iminobutanoate/2-iminopropanoate deaminase
MLKSLRKIMKFKTVISDVKDTPYSDALDMGNLIQFSGMMGLDDNGLVKGGVIAETRQIFKNLKQNLDFYQLNYSNVVKALVMLKNMGEFQDFNAVYLEHLSKPYPVRSTFGVADLAFGACVEIEFLVSK